MSISYSGVQSRDLNNPSVNPSSNLNYQKNNLNNIIEEIDENEELEFGEEEEEKEEDNIEDKKNEEFQIRNQGGEGKSRLERIFIYLRSGFSWRPIPTINSTVLCLLITGAFFIIIGAIILGFSLKIKQIEIRYDNNENCEIGSTCYINFTITKDMKKDVFVYYRLKHFYQNHRRYMRSKSIKQLKGKIMKEGDIKDECEPIILNKDIYEGVNSTSGKPLDPDGVAHPCGLIAKSFFNDTFEIKKQGSDKEIFINGTNIAWSIDKDKFKNSDNISENQWLDVENERFIVWMRPAALPDFRKPWGRIEQDLNKGDYTLAITNNYPVKSFEGKKYFILTTVNAIGGKNYFLAILYFVIGGVSIIASVLFWFGYKKYNEEEKLKLE